ncbi:hypothetical protein [Phycicoccus sp.]|jgi:hypothetical protein|uniref:hypothetical protein n=1 Tax=Phycicoccus sp. TaxID=1902410 RepID=UPI002C17E685|nr:hypothetical protein [Phycicoccus sp.]HMM96544.1 hypothetical protein [Phycicoccus sp.]
MSTDTRPTRDDARSILAHTAALLAHASDLTWSEVRTDPSPQKRFLGLGLDLAACEAARLLPSGLDVDVPGADALATNVQELVRAAEGCLRLLPIEQFPPGTSQLVVDICDLIRESAP